MLFHLCMLALLFMLVLLCMLIPPKGAGPMAIMLWHNGYVTNCRVSPSCLPLEEGTAAGPGDNWSQVPG